jgi:hypothetical protein
MKTLLRVVVVTMFVLIIASQFSFGQLAFGIKPGETLNSAYAGLKLGGLVVFGGFEYIHGGANIDFTAKQTGFPDDKYINEKLSGNLYVPYVGAKMFLLSSGSVKGYVTGTVSKPWLSASVQPDSGKEAVAWTDYKGAKTYVKDVVSDISLWEFSVAVGSEYFFSDNFSVGGEFGFRYLVGSYKKTIQTSATSSVAVDISAGLSATYSTLTLNYYF